jgi:hypothetical protein
MKAKLSVGRRSNYSPELYSLRISEKTLSTQTRPLSRHQQEQFATVMSQPESVKATLEFLSNLELYEHTKPYRIIGKLPADQESLRDNLTSHRVPDQEIHNARHLQHSFSLNSPGFQFVSYSRQTQLIKDNEASFTQYLQEIASFHKAYFRTDHVFSYDLRVGIQILVTGRKVLNGVDASCRANQAKFRAHLTPQCQKPGHADPWR